MLLLMPAGALWSAEPPALRLVTENSPPLSMQNGDSPERVTGMVTELLRDALSDAGIKFSFAILPWARAFRLAQTDRQTCIYSTTLMADRAAQFKWIGPLLPDKWVILGRPDSPPLSDIGDLRNSVVGTYIDDATAFFMRERGISVRELVNDELNVKMLSAGRVDYWMLGTYRERWLRRLGRIDDFQVKLIIDVDSLYLACNPGVPDGVVARLNQAVAKRIADGTLAALQARWLELK